MALLSGARNEKNAYLAENMYTRMKALFPGCSQPLMAAAVLLANTYASAGETDKSLDVRKELDKSHVKRKVGLTWTFADGQIYVSTSQHICVQFAGNGR